MTTWSVLKWKKKHVLPLIFYSYHNFCIAWGVKRTSFLYIIDAVKTVRQFGFEFVYFLSLLYNYLHKTENNKQQLYNVYCTIHFIRVILQKKYVTHLWFSVISPIFKISLLSFTKIIIAIASPLKFKNIWAIMIEFF